MRKLVVASASFRSDGMPPEALAMFPSITPELFAGSPIEAEYQRLAPDPGDFPKLVEKLRTLDSAPFAWPDEDIRAIPNGRLYHELDGRRILLTTAAEDVV